MLESPHLNACNSILVGDFNVDLIKKEDDVAIMTFANNLQALYYICAISEATRFPAIGQHGSPSLLDHIWIKGTELIAAGVFYCDITDHCPTFVKIAHKVEECCDVMINYRTFSSDNIEYFAQFLRDTNWESILVGNVNEATEGFMTKLYDVYNNIFPVQNKTITHKRMINAWITPAVSRSLKTKSYYFKLNKMGRMPNANYKAYCNRLTAVVRAAKRKYYSSIFINNKSNPKATWAHINKLLGKRNKNVTINEIAVNNVIYTNPKAIADHMNNYFSNIAENINSNIPETGVDPLSYLQNSPANSMFFGPISKLMCKEAIGELRDTRANVNSISIKIIKKVKDAVAMPIARIINMSFQSGIFPDCLKTAKITPIHKTGSEKTISNYRPISVLPWLSKIFEKCIAKQLMNYLEHNTILISTQFGFRKNKSTQDAMVQFTELLYSALDSKQHCISVFIDLQKAFDTVDHR
ncbi:hypothetical protein SNEBB_002555, partial [Seison nebaliae]